MTKLVIIGGVAGGASAAARARRLDERMSIVMLEKGPYVSFANCGLPYYIGNEIKDRNKLLLQTPESFKARFNVDVRTNSEVTSIDRSLKTVTVRDHNTGKEYREPYDFLVYSPGAVAIMPPIPGLKDVLGRKVFPLRTIPDMDGIMARVAVGKSRKMLIVGGGFIGLELAEAAVHRGWKAIIVEKAAQVMGPLDPEMANYLHKELERNGVELLLNTGAEGFEDTENGLKVKLGSGRGTLEVDVGVVCIGVRPDVGLAEAAGLKIGPLGGVKVDRLMRTSDRCIYAVGDAVETPALFSPAHTLLPALAGPANRQGRACAGNLLGELLAYSGTQSTAVCRVFSLSVGSVGASEKLLRRWNVPHTSIYLHAPSHAGYYPGAALLHLKLTYQLPSGDILGAQVVGGEGVDKRVDILAVAQRANMTVFDLQHLELSYAPPFNSAKDIVNQAGFVAANIANGLVKVCRCGEVDSPSASQAIVDVRTPQELEEEGCIPNAINIPVDELRQRHEELPKDKELLVYCRVGIRGHVACMALSHLGYQVKNLTGGYRTWQATHAKL